MKHEHSQPTTQAPTPQPNAHLASRTSGSKVYLASQSPRRQELLAQLGWRFELLLPSAVSDLIGLQCLQSKVKAGVKVGVEVQAVATRMGSKKLKPNTNTNTNTAAFAPSLSQALEDLERVRDGEGALAYVQRVTHLKFELARHLASRLGPRYDPRCPLVCADTTVVLDQRILGKPQNPLEAQAMMRALSGRTHRVYTCVMVGDLSHQAQRVSRSWVSFAPLSERAMENYVQTQEWVGKAGGYAVQGRAAALISQIRGSYSGIMGLPLFETAELLEDFVQRGRAPA